MSLLCSARCVCRPASRSGLACTPSSASRTTWPLAGTVATWISPPISCRPCSTVARPRCASTRAWWPESSTERVRPQEVPETSASRGAPKSGPQKGARGSLRSLHGGYETTTRGARVSVHVWRSPKEVPEGLCMPKEVRPKRCPKEVPESLLNRPGFSGGTNP